MTLRAFIAVASLVALIGTPGTMSAQSTGEPSFTLKEIGPKVWVAVSNPRSKEPAGANTGFVIGDDAVAVIDTTMTFGADGFNTDVARQMVAAIRNLTPLPIKFVINTHYHLDHVGANSVFVNEGAVVVAHENVRRWIHSEHLRVLPKDVDPRIRGFMEALVPPTVTLGQSLQLHLGSRTIQVQTYPGHTGGDAVVVIPDAKVVFAGDLFWHRTIPTLIDASTEPLINTLDTLARTGSGTRFVAGHGDVGDAADVSAFRDYLATLRKLVAEAQALRKEGDGLVEAVTAGLKEQYGGWDGFEAATKDNILEVDAEMHGRKRVPQ